MDVSQEDAGDEYHRSFRDSSPPRTCKFSIWKRESRRMTVVFTLFKAYFFHGFALQMIAIAVNASADNRLIFFSSYTSLQPKQFYWNSDQVEAVLRAFHIGFLFSVLGGFLAQKFGGAKVFAKSMVLTSIALLFNLLISMFNNHRLFVLSYWFIGVFQGCCLVSTTEIFGAWLVKKERTVVMFFVTTGIYLGAAIAQYLYTYCNYFIDLPWFMYTFIAGMMCFVCGIDFDRDIKNLPEEDNDVPELELVYILQNTITTMRQRDIKPCKNIATSLPCWALFAVQYALGWASSFALAYSPTCFLKDTYENLRTDQLDDGVYGYLLPIANTSDIFIVPFVGLAITFWQNYSHIKPTNLHKIIIGVSYTIAAIFFLILTACPKHYHHLGFSLFCLAVIKPILSYSYVICQIIVLNLAPNHSSILSGFAIFWQTVGALILQTVGRYANQNREVENWSVCFFSSGVTLLLSMAVFIVVGSSKPQMWSMAGQLDQYENRRTASLELINISNDS